MSCKGVIVHLQQGTYIPAWIKDHPRVEVHSTTRNGTPIRSLSIRGGEAGFIPGGLVCVKMPRRRSWVVIFKPLAVLVIRNLHGQELVRNHYFCGFCYRNTGEVISRVPSNKDHGCDNVILQCSICGRQYSRVI
jgi:hypothetical protein